MKNLEITLLPTDILEKSVEVRRNYNLSIFDSIHAGVCLIKEKRLVSTTPFPTKLKN